MLISGISGFLGIFSGFKVVKDIIWENGFSMVKITRLSSLFTFFYKFIVPIMPVGLAVFVNYTIDKESNNGYFIPVNLFFAIFFSVVFFPLYRIRKVEYTKNNLKVSNYFKSETYKLSSIVSVKRWLFYFYKISIDTNEGIKRIQFMPHIYERLLRPFGKLDSIIKFEKIIK